MSKSFPIISEKGGGFQGIGPLPTFWPFKVSFRTVMMLVRISLNMLMDYNECIMRLTVWSLEVKSSTILDIVSSNQFLSCPMAMSFF